MQIQNNSLYRINTTVKKQRITEDKSKKYGKIMKRASFMLAKGLGVTAGFVAPPAVTATGLISNGIKNTLNENGNENEGISSLGKLQNQNQQWNMDFLRLQMEIQAENRKYSTLSNILKAKHDTSKAAINNMRV